MKTLVIHPEDYSTRFLSVIYDRKDWTVITTDCSRKELEEQIRYHDRIIMLGHGLPMGLLGFGRLFIDNEMVFLLQNKLCVCIWCNADLFVKEYNLKGFYTGMIISEYDEATMFGIKPNPLELQKSNIDFANAIRQGIDKEKMLDVVKKKYKGDGPIYQFNMKRIYSNL